jgi:lactoylglutathione lyase
MKTLHTAYRVADLTRSLDFYLTLGFAEVGRVPLPGDVTLVCLKLQDDAVTTLELVDDPAARPIEIGNGLSHIVVRADDLTGTVARLSEAGITCGPIERPGPMTSWLSDPDGYRIELVEWPPGHPDGVTSADFADAAPRPQESP